MHKLLQIHGKIGTETAFRIPVSVEDAIAEGVKAYDAMVKERYELAARVERLQYIVSECHQQILDNEYIDDLAHEAAFGKPSACQLLHDAGVLEKFAAGYLGQCDDPVIESFYDDLTEAAADLRQQAAALEGKGDEHEKRIDHG